MTLFDLLRLCDPATTKLAGKRQTRLLRHRAKPPEVRRRMRDMAVFEEYQAHQGERFFDGAGHVIGLIAEGRQRSRFMGVGASTG
jgi:hypothetical protein